MRWSALAILLLVAATGAATLIGTFLPREHSARRVAVFQRDAQTIWAVLTDFPGLSLWMPGVREVSPAPAGNGRQRWLLETGEGRLLFEVAEAVEPRLLVTRIIDTGQGFGGTWTYELERVSGSTRLSITEQGWVSNPLFRFLTRYVFGTTRTMDASLRALGRHLGETVTPLST